MYSSLTVTPGVRRFPLIRESPSRSAATWSWALRAESIRHSLLGDTFQVVQLVRRYAKRPFQYRQSLPRQLSLGRFAGLQHRKPDRARSRSPQLTPANQTVIVGATGINAGLSLSNGTSGRAGLASLDVNSLGSGVSGPTGGELVASGSSQAYTATLNTNTLGTQIETFESERDN